MHYLRKTLLITLLVTGTPSAGAQTDAAAFKGLQICYSFECSRQQFVWLSYPQWQSTRALFSPAATSAPEERAMIRSAIAQLETFTGALAGTAADRGGNLEGAGLPGQMDCIDESTNTTNYLILLQQDGLLRWHEVQEPVRRSKWVLDVHWSAVMRESVSGQRWAVDSWFLDNGEPPYIQRLEDWLDKEDFPGE